MPSLPVITRSIGISFDQATQKKKRNSVYIIRICRNPHHHVHSNTSTNRHIAPVKFELNGETISILGCRKCAAIARTLLESDLFLRKVENSIARVQAAEMRHNKKLSPKTKELRTKSLIADVQRFRTLQSYGLVGDYSETFKALFN